MYNLDELKDMDCPLPPEPDDWSKKDDLHARVAKLLGANVVIPADKGMFPGLGTYMMRQRELRKKKDDK